MVQKSSKKALKPLEIDQTINNAVQKIGQILLFMGFRLEDYQPHVTGERKIKSLTKLVLLGQDKRGRRVIVKTSDKSGEKRKIEQEKKIRQELEKISAVSKNILIPRQIFYGRRNGFLLLITEFIDQPKIFVAHNLKEQFEMIRRAIEGHELINLKEFRKTVGKRHTCPIFTEKKYLRELNKQINFINKNYKDAKLRQTLMTAKKVFATNTSLTAKYSGYLVHDDFCPHNFRVNNGKIYLLDYNAANLGNKYITWARLLNYMVLHNSKLERQILGHFKKNLTPEGLECLRVFRIYKTVFLIMYYVKTSKKTSGNLLKLTKVRINFWHNFLKKLIENKSLAKKELGEYIKQRDSLRSGEEKKRQKEFAVA